MLVLLDGLGLLACSFLVQLVLFRVRLPSRHTPALLLVYTLVPLIVTAAAWGVHVLPALSPPEVVRVGLFYISFSLAYIVVHSALEMQSPTLAIVSCVAKAGPNGCSDEILSARFGRGVELAQRLALMEQGGWIQSAGDVVTLSPQGRSYAMLFEHAGRAFGLAMGG